MVELFFWFKNYLLKLSGSIATRMGIQALRFGLTASSGGVSPKKTRKLPKILQKTSKRKKARFLATHKSCC